MTIRHTLALLALPGLGLVSATAATAAPIGDRALLTQPVAWAARPGEAAVAAAYPQGAKGIGYANVGCLMGIGGMLKDCRVVGEAPQGFGFGAAALTLVPAYRVNRGADKAAPDASASVFLPIEFDPPGPRPAIDPINCLPPLCVLEIAPGQTAPAQP